MLVYMGVEKNPILILCADINSTIGRYQAGGAGSECETGTVPSANLLR